MPAYCYCPGCDEVSLWQPEDEVCDVCGEELLAADSSEPGIALLLQTHSRVERQRKLIALRGTTIQRLKGIRDDLLKVCETAREAVAEDSCFMCPGDALDRAHEILDAAIKKAKGE